MGTHTEDERILCDGRVVIYQRTDVAKPHWHCRIKFPDQPYIRQSLKTANEKDAIKLAIKLYEDLRYRSERGMPLKRLRFDAVLDRYLEHLTEEVRSGNQKQHKLTDQKNMSRYCREYFDGKYIDTIITGDIAKYHEWRRRYWITGTGSKQDTYQYERNGKIVNSKTRAGKEPAISTINSENVLLRSIFNFASMNDWITKSQIPTISLRIPSVKRSRESKRRPGLTPEQVKHLLEISQKRLDAVANDARLYHQRFMLHHFVGILANTGMRDFEGIKIMWSDIQLSKMTKPDNQYNNTFTKVRTDGKGDRERWLIPLDGFDDFLDSLGTFTYEFRMKALGYPDDDIEAVVSFDDKRRIFVDYDGSDLKSLSRGFSALLKEADLYLDERGKMRDAYCLRHFYATERLLAGVGIYTLAENMGTSVQMIERHYGHLKPEQAAIELTKPSLK
ncbi:MAG: hypothetical protein WCF85_07335 [Rhodospirillaceae bacterium]